jgi:1-phosphofructokinase
MIVTVTLNPAIDKTLLIPGFRLGATNRGTIERLAIGGKGLNVARTLARLGCEVVATGFLGADDRHGVTTFVGTLPGVTADFLRGDSPG